MYASEAMPLMVLGSVPFSWFWLTPKYCNRDSVLIVLGIVPVSAPPYNDMDINFVSSEMPSGMVPVNEFACRNRFLNSTTRA
jgi:hypothetical protein